MVCYHLHRANRQELQKKVKKRWKGEEESRTSGSEGKRRELYAVFLSKLSASDAPLVKSLASLSLGATGNQKSESVPIEDATAAAIVSVPVITITDEKSKRQKRIFICFVLIALLLLL